MAMTAPPEKAVIDPRPFQNTVQWTLPAVKIRAQKIKDLFSSGVAISGTGVRGVGFGAGGRLVWKKAASFASSLYSGKESPL